MLYLVIDIGCIECGEASHFVGAFTDKARAEEVAEQRSGFYGGQHYGEIFEFDPNTVNQVLVDS